ncbi:DoxX family protein [Larkinella bovis]|uniref:DoxX family protein n=1 Tax=Larkinella bovis TaxID=683041 RepID=A0ABW0I9E9_9BACT
MKTISVPEEHPPFPLRRIVSTGHEIAPLIIRVVLGLVLFPHGAQKLLGWFGGYGFDGTMTFFTETVHLPYWLALSVVLLEFFAPFFLVLGLVTRVMASLVGLLFVGIILTSHLPYGFFMNWYGNQSGEGFEYHLLVLAMTVSLLLSGGGKLSIDNRLQ